MILAPDSKESEISSEPKNDLEESVAGANSNSTAPWQTPAGVVRRVLTSASFIEKLTLLLLTGIVVPILIIYFNLIAGERQKAIDTNRARDSSILQAQSKLLDEFSETVFAYETLALDVSRFKLRPLSNEEMHQKAYTRYSERVIDIVAKWRSLIGRARTLASPTVSDKMQSFLAQIYIEQDNPIHQLYGQDGTQEQWEVVHRMSEAMLATADHLIAELAKDIGLTKDNLHKMSN